MRIVTPFRPFEPESVEHQHLGAFDWHDAIRMMAASARLATEAEAFVITDVDAPDAPIPSYRYVTRHRRLMTWLLEVALCYIESDDFDDDTVMLSPDILVTGDLRPYFRGDLGVIVRTAPKFAESGRTILNGAQWWAVHAKKPLTRFYRQALLLAKHSPEERLVWGADTDPLITLLSPVVAGPSIRRGMSFHGFEANDVMPSLTQYAIDRLDRGEYPPMTAAPLVDFKYLKKRHMRPYFDAVYGRAVPA